jgi:hypothetical protein
MRLFRSLTIGSLSAVGMMFVLNQVNTVSAADAKALTKAELKNLTKAEKLALRQKLKDTANNATATPPAKSAEIAPPPVKTAPAKVAVAQDPAMHR